MSEQPDTIGRRRFLKTMGAVGLGPVLAASQSAADPSDARPDAAADSQQPRHPQVPRRKLGKTGVELPCLALGTVPLNSRNAEVLPAALQWGVDYWDTATNYQDTRSESAIGQYLAENPGLREKLFLATKPRDIATPLPVIADLEKELQASLKRLHTNYVDLYYAVHNMTDPAQLTDDLKDWVAKAKKRGVIRLFGLSAHSDMAAVLTSVPKLGWVDVVMIMYNFRLMQDEQYQAGLEACSRAGIGLVAIKTQGRGLRMETQSDQKLASRFLSRGFTEAQAKLKAVLEDKRITTAAVGTPSLAVLTSNVAAVLDRTRLTRADRAALEQYAQATCGAYCAGCKSACESVLPQVPYVREIMRQLMYCNTYGEKERARALFAEIPAEVRDRLLATDYTLAEARCPQRLAIGDLVAEAVDKLA